MKCGKKDSKTEKRDIACRCVWICSSLPLSLFEWIQQWSPSKHKLGGVESSLGGMHSPLAGHAGHLEN